MLEEIASIAAALPDRAILAVDGVDGVGKTTFAIQLRPLIEKRGRHVLRASVDGFHNPRAIRYRLGKSDPSGYFMDSYNYAEMKACLLDPFRNGEGSLVTKRFDYRLDAPDTVIEPADSTAILVIDGIFLHRDELRHYWNFSVFLDAPFDVSFQRMSRRDGSDPNPDSQSNQRYLKGQQIYFKECRPLERASIVIDVRS
jgi:uridine kinase